MRKSSAWWVAVAVLLVALGAGVRGVGQAGQIDRQGEALLQAAKNTELVKGDLKGAIDQYKQILARQSVGRTVAAKALLEMGLCYEKLGQADARTAYEQLLRQYGDQAEQVQAARARLAALGGASGQAARTEMTIRRVLSAVWADGSASPSPDGRFLAIVDPESGDLATWDVATGQKRRLTNKGSWSTSETALSSTWSPDGKKIAFAWLNKDMVAELRIIGNDGSEPRLLSSAAWPRAWSPDGRSLLAMVSQDNNTAEMAVVSVADGSATILTKDGKPISSWNGGFSADGKYIVYDVPQQAGSPERDVYITSIDGKQTIPLVQHPAGDQLLGWIPGSDAVLFASDRTGTRDAWVLRVADGKPQGEPVLVRKDIGRVSPMGFSDRGAFYYNVGVSVVDVFEGSLDLAKGALAEPPKKVTQGMAGTHYSPGWSPDGRYLAYVAERQTASSRRHILCIRAEQSGEEREVPLAIDGFWQAHWSADGRAVFATMSDKASQGLFKIDIQTGTHTPLARSAANESIIKSFAVSPDGKSVYYGHFQWMKKLITIVRHDLETGKGTEVYRKTAPPDVTVGAVSPDGKSLSFITAELLAGAGPVEVIRIVPATGGETRDLLRSVFGNDAYVARHYWTPDGKAILFVKHTFSTTKDERNELWQVDSAGGEPRKMNIGMDVRELQLHPDGRRIVFTSGTTSKEVWVMENFLPAPKGGK